MFTENKDKDVEPTKELEKLRNKMIYDITTRLEQFSLNTVISGFMEYNNKLVELTKKGGVDRETLKALTLLIAPFAPHLGEEMWEQLGGTDSVFHQAWPTYDESKMADDEKEIAVQINGKTKGLIRISVDADKDTALSAAKEAVADKLTGNIVKEIYVPGRIVNLVMK
jgi:leucyl-tRNA synthetase